METVRSPRPALAPAQQALWRLDGLEPGTTRYHVPVVLEITGRLDAAVLDSVLARIVARHETLRTAVAVDDGRPYPLVAPPPDSVLAVVDLGDAPAAERAARCAQLVAGWSAEPFDLARGPLLRARLVRLGPDEHVLGLFLHHIVCDGLSLRVLFDEIEEGYRGAEPRAPLALRFTEWADRTARREVDDDVVTWWRETLDGAPTALVPRSGATGTAGSGLLRVPLPAAAVAAGRALAREARTTPFVVMLAAWATALGRLTGSPDVVLGVPSAHRPAPELEEVIGLFVNTVPVRVDLTGDPGPAELAGRTRDALLAALDHQLPFETLVERLSPPRRPGSTPLVPVAFGADPVPLDPPRLAGLTTRLRPFPAQPPKFDLDAALGAVPDGDAAAELTLSYATTALRPAAVRWLAECFVALLGAPGAPDPGCGLAPEDRPVLGGRLGTPSPPAGTPPAPAASTGWERRIAEVWREVLAAEEIGRHDNFFDLGGSSRGLGDVHRRLAADVAGGLPLIVLYEYPTVAGLAGHLAGAPGPAPAGRPPAPEPGRDRLARLRRRRP